MKELNNKKFWQALSCLVAAITCAFVAYSTVTGELQKMVHFEGEWEEIFFFVIVSLIGLIFLTIFITTLLPGSDTDRIFTHHDRGRKSDISDL